MHRSLLTLLIVAFILAGCGSTPPPPSSTTPLTATSSPETSSAATAVSSASPSAAPTTSSEAFGSIDATIRERLEQGYTALVLIDASTTMLEEATQQVKDGKLEGVEGLGSMIAIGAILEVTNEALGQEPADPAFAGVWPDARAVTAKLQDLVKRWVDKKISSTEVANELAMIRLDVDKVMMAAEESLASEYKVDSGELRKIRTEALAELRKSFQERSSPEPSASAVAEAGTSRSEPLTFGTPVRFDTWAITLTDVLRGDEAAAQIRETNQFNEEAREGHEYLLVTFQLENVSTKQDAQNTTFAMSLRVVGDKHVAYSPVSVVTPQELEGELFPGGTATGQEVFEVPTGEKNLMLMLGELASIDQPTYFMALDPDAKLMVDPALESIKPTDVGATRDAPAKLGEQVTTADWEITLLEVKRGDEAAKLVEEANEFNDDAGADKEYVAIKVHARYIGTRRPNQAEDIGGGSFKITGEKNVVYDAPSVVAPSPNLDVALFPGGEVEGWEVLSVTKDEQNLRVIFEPLYSFDKEQTRYLAIE